MPDSPRFEIDFATGRPILQAPHRRNRPLHTAPDAALGDCPFCPGQEDQTPPERDAVRRDGSGPDRPGWHARAFENKYPAARWHEVIAEGDEHLEQPGDLSLERTHDAVELWCRRIEAMESEPDVRCAFLFKNVGRFAGASVRHNHSQMLGLPGLPPRFELLLRRHRTHGDAVAHALDTARGDGRVVFEGEAHTALTPPTPRMPDELWVVPHRAPGRDLLDRHGHEDLARVLRAAWIGVREALDRPALNMWLHRIPGVAGGHGFVWHFQIQPRTGFLAGLELGGDMTINAVTPEESAARMREGLGRTEAAV